MEDLVERARIVPVTLVRIVVARRRRYRPAVGAVVGLGPPAVQDAAVDGAVDGRLHSRSAAGLHRMHRGVEPDVDAGRQQPPQPHVVAFDQQDLAEELRQVRHPVDFLHELLSRHVRGMRLAGEHEDDRAFVAVDDLFQPAEILEEQRRAL